MAGVIKQAAKVINNAKALVITAGAGMGVDSGLMDFKDEKKFGEMFPALKQMNMSGQDVSTPEMFVSNPHLAWGFFAKCLKIFKDATPHQGFDILKRWAYKKELGYFVYTSNADGHFQKAGFAEDRLVECHGNSYFLQGNDFKEVWPVPDEGIPFDDKTLKALDPLPRGPPGYPPDEQVIARPNIDLYEDESFNPSIRDAQDKRIASWLQQIHGNNVVVIEIGSSATYPVVREKGEDIVATSGHKDSCLVRINTAESTVSGRNDISVPMKALEALVEIDKYVR